MALDQEEASALHSLKCQYFQLVEPRIIEFPAARLLSRSHFQEAIYESLFSPAASKHPPPERYTGRVLKRLITLLEETQATSPPSHVPHTTPC